MSPIISAFGRRADFLTRRFTLRSLLGVFALPLTGHAGRTYAAWSEVETGTLGPAGSYVIETDYIVTTAVRWEGLPQSDDPDWRVQRRLGPLVFARRLLLCVTV